MKINRYVKKPVQVEVPGHRRNVLVTFTRFFELESKLHWVFAGQIEANLEIIQKAWKLPTANMGDFIILMPNGDVQLMSELDFGETYQRTKSQ